MKKLFYIANLRLPTEKAHGIQIMKMCEAFANAGISVELIVPRRLNPLKADPFLYYGVKNNFKITRLPVLDTVSWGHIGFWFETLTFLLFARLYLLGKKGVVYTREEAAGLFFRDFVLELHTRLRTRVLLPRKIFVLTHLLKDELLAQNIPSQNIHILPDAVDIAQFDISVSKEEARRKVNLPLNKKIVMYSGSFFLYDWKGVDVMLEAAKDFGNEALFVLVGGSGEDTENVLFAGRQTPTEIPLFLKAADVLVLPNKKGSEMSEKHTSPLKLFEYMAAGRAIICSDLPSLREVVSEKEVLFFEPNNSAALADAIKKILANTVLAEDLAHHSQTRAAYFSWERRVQSVLAFMTA